MEISEDGIVGIIATGLIASHLHDPLVTKDGSTRQNIDLDPKDALHYARAVLAALKEQGLVIVPGAADANRT